MCMCVFVEDRKGGGKGLEKEERRKGVRGERGRREEEEYRGG